MYLEQFLMNLHIGEAISIEKLSKEMGKSSEIMEIELVELIRNRPDLGSYNKIWGEFKRGGLTDVLDQETYDSYPDIDSESRVEPFISDREDMMERLLYELSGKRSLGL